MVDTDTEKLYRCRKMMAELVREVVTASVLRNRSLAFCVEDVD